jgi:REP element-mobilizing transposase RayT
MTRPLRLEREGAIWHITSRGVERRNIFLDRNDRFSFIELLGNIVVLAHWHLHAYVLMSNHYHLLLDTPERTLSLGMKRLNETWAEHFNWRHDRVGHLFQGRFDSRPVDAENHLRELFRYIVLNPVRCGAAEYAADYEWSNYRATAGLEQPPEWLEVGWTLSHFHEDRALAAELYRQFVAAGRGAKPCPWEPRSVMKVVCESFAETPETLRHKSRRPGRKAFAQLAREGCRMTFCEIGCFLRVTEDAASDLAAAGRELERTNSQYRAALAHARAQLTPVGV